MASNNLLTIDMITREYLNILENTLVVTRNVNRQYDSSFAQTGAKIGSTLRIRLPNRYTVANTATLQVQPTDNQYTTLTVSNRAQCSVSFTSEEQTMKLDDYSEAILKPAASQVAAYIDADVCAGVYKQIYNSVGTPGTTPSTSLVMLQAQALLNKSGATMMPRFFTVNPDAQAALVEGAKGLFNPQGDISSQYKTGTVGKNVYNFDEVVMSQSIANHTTGSRSTSDTIVVNGTVTTQGQTTLSFDGGTGSATVLEGDVFTIAGVYAVNPQTRQSTGSLQQFVVRESSTASGGAWTNVTVSPAMYTQEQQLATITAFPQDGAALTFMGAASTSYPQNLVYHRDAITFATVDLVMPNGVNMASRQVHNGISMRIVSFYDGVNDTLPCRTDVLYGYKVIRPEMAVRVWG